MKINVILDVDEKTILEESGQSTLTEAIRQELGWLRDSGMFVEKWSYLEQEMEKRAPEEAQAPAMDELDELVVRLSYYAGTLEAGKLISPPEWPELMDAISNCIAEYYDGHYDLQATSIEEVARRTFLETFPVEPLQQEGKTVPSQYAGPEELVVRLAHLAGNLEAESHIGAAEWDDLTVAIHEMVDAYLNDPSESVNPFCLEEAAERYFVIQFGLDEFREAAIAEGWSNKSPSELIADAKKSFRTVPDLPEENMPQAHNKNYYVETDNGPELLDHGFTSVSNFKNHPDRVCYVPENWDFEEDGPGITGQDIIDLCDGDKLKARMVFELCDWQHPSTILGEWDHDDDVALDELRASQGQAVKPPAFNDILNSAKDRAANQQNQQQGTEPHR